MMQGPRGGSCAALAGGAILLCLALAPSTALAQAWLPEKGSLTLSIDYADVLNKKHYISNGSEVDVGHTSQAITTLAVSYSPSDRVMVDLALPYVSARYSGDFPHPTDVDDGDWHSEVTDLQVTVHFQASEGPIAFAPYVAAVIPTHDYEVLGHGAPGRGLEEYWLGFYAACSLHEWIPRTYVQLRGNYAFVEEVAGVSHDRINATLEIGHFLNKSWSVRALVSEQRAHGGVDIPIPPTDPLFPFHDQLAADEFVNVGGGAGWSINGRLSIYGLYMQSIEGRNSHKVDHRVSVGMTYGFGRD